jgi:hypothetical protein
MWSSGTSFLAAVVVFFVARHVGMEESWWLAVPIALIGLAMAYGWYLLAIPPVLGMAAAALWTDTWLAVIVILFGAILVGGWVHGGLQSGAGLSLRSRRIG